MRGLAVGVDAGGTNTTVASSRDGNPLPIVNAPCASSSALGVEDAAQRIAQAVAQLGARPDALYVGAAGAGNTSVAASLTSALRELLALDNVVVRDDAHIALRARLPSGDGTLLLAGTGSIAYAERGEVTYRCGGYGYLLGDEGSGYAIGNAALRHLARVLDRRAQPDALSNALQTSLDVHDLTGLFPLIYNGTKSVQKIAAFAPIVLECAQRDVRSAAKIVQGAALDLSELLRALFRKAAFKAEEVPVVFAGGLLSSNSMLTFLLETRIQNDFPEVRLIKGGPAPHEGALRLAEGLLPG